MHKQEIFNQLIFLSSLYPSAKIESSSLHAMTELLSREFTIEQIKNGISRASKKCKFFPSYAEIYETINPTINVKDEANELVGVIFEAVRTRDYTDLDGVAHLAIERFGGAKVIGMIEYDQMATARAQMRDIIQSILAMKDRNPELERLDYQKQTRQAIEQHEGKIFRPLSESMKELTEGIKNV